MDKIYIIPIIFGGVDGKIATDLVGVTDEEFIEWYENKTMPKAQIPVVFMKEYFKKHKHIYDFDTMTVRGKVIPCAEHLSDLQQSKYCVN